MTFRISALACALAMAGAASLDAQAASENIFVDNGSIATAQVLGPLSDEGVLNVSGVRGFVSIFGTSIDDNDDADFYAFNVGANRTVTLRVDTPEGPLRINDPMVALYSQDGTRLAVDDDGGPGYDSLLSFLITAPGTYFAAVTGFDDFNFNGVSDLYEDGEGNTPVPSTNFIYNLQISAVATAPVPVPAAGWLLGSALLGLARRRKAA